MIDINEVEPKLAEVRALSNALDVVVAHYNKPSIPDTMEVLIDHLRQAIYELHSAFHKPGQSTDPQILPAAKRGAS